MKCFTSPFIFLAILGAATSKVIQAGDTLENVDPFAIDGCWFDKNPHDPSDTHYMCETAGGILLPPEDGDFTTPEKCQAECVSREDKPIAEDGCKYWAFKHLGPNGPKCYMLDDCYQDTNNHCTPDIGDDAKCASGPRTCDQECPKLEYEGGLDKAHWSCIHPGSDVQPYQAAIPGGSLCTAKCPVWKDGSGQSVPTVTAHCNPDGTWEDATPAVDPAIGKPGDSPNPPCTCDPINIDPATFETDNMGAELYCTDNEGKGDFILQTGKVTIEKMMNCIFMCDKQFVLEIACSQGTWTNGITDCTSFYCWKQPDAADRCDGTV